MASDRWSTTALLREAMLNAFGRGSRLRIFALIAVFLGAAQVVFGAVQLAGFESELGIYARDGRNVLVYVSSDPAVAAQIDRRSCEAAGDLPGVERAGLVVPDVRQTFLQLGSSVPVVRASPSLIPELKSYDAVLGYAIWAGTSPVRIENPSGPGSLDAVVGPIQPAGIDANSAIAFGLPSDQITGPTCVVVLQPHARSSQYLATVQAGLHVSGSAIAGMEVLKLPIDPIDMYLQRPELWLPVMLGCGGGLAVGLSNRARAGELAVYRLSGTSARSLALILLFEQLQLAGLLAFAGTAAALALFQYIPNQTSPIALNRPGFRS